MQRMLKPASLTVHLLAIVLAGCSASVPPPSHNDRDRDGDGDREPHIDDGDSDVHNPWGDGDSLGDGDGDGDGTGEGDGDGDQGDPDPEPSVFEGDPPPPCGSTVAVGGALYTDIATVDVHPTASGTSAFWHRIDVDPEDDRCITSFSLSLQLHENGCLLDLTFTTNHAGVGYLSSVEFEADSFCPGFLDGAEGRFWMNGIGDLWPLEVPVHVPDFEAEQSCLMGLLLQFPDRPLRLRRSSGAGAEYLEINLKDLEVFGSPVSDGNPASGNTGSCRVANGCPEDMTDGGRGWCLALGDCEEDFMPTLHDMTCTECGPVGGVDLGGECLMPDLLPAAQHDVLAFPSSLQGLSVAPESVHLIDFTAPAGSQPILQLTDCSGDPYVILVDDSGTEYITSQFACYWSGDADEIWTFTALEETTALHLVILGGTEQVHIGGLAIGDVPVVEDEEPAWTCSASFYDAGDGCDCGCGVVDPDCPDATVDSCTYCTETGSCADGASCSSINANDNSKCGD